MQRNSENEIAIASNDFEAKIKALTSELAKATGLLDAAKHEQINQQQEMKRSFLRLLDVIQWSVSLKLGSNGLVQGQVVRNTPKSSAII